MNYNLINYTIGATTFAGIKNNLASSVAPLATNDSSQGYSVGSVWIDSVTNIIYIATSVAPGAANWVATTGGGGGTTTQNNFIAALNPAISNDSAQGYSVGSHWINTVTNDVFVCTSPAVGAAVWTYVSNVSNSINNLVAVVSPVPANDAATGYGVGSLWINTTTSSVFMCLNATIGLAVWVELTNSSTPLMNIAGVIAPVVTNDSTQGYSVGSIWNDVSADLAYICMDSTANTAVWKPITNHKDNLVAIVPPAATDDSTLGYSVGSTWLDIPNNDMYVCIVDIATNAAWSRITPEVTNNFAAIISPTPADDSTAKYDVGSIWIVGADNNSFICTSNAVANAVWIEITKPIEHNLVSNIAPGAANSALQGYAVGSIWVNTVTDIAYMSVDSTAGAAVWMPIGSPGASGTNSLTYHTIATIAPANTNDTVSGYIVGSLWVDTISNRVYVSVDGTTNAAIWVRIDGAGGAGGSSLQNNFLTNIDPTVADDSAAGYSIGSMWINTLGSSAFICISSAVGAAVWHQIDGVGGSTNNYAATSVPLATNDSAGGYSVGSVWVDVIANKSYICVDSTVAAAIWVETSPAASLKDNLIAVVSPATTDNGLAGYSIGSKWVNTLTSKVYFCTKSTAPATWVEVTSSIASNYTAIVSPTATDDSSIGYTVGSHWINTLLDITYECVDATPAAAIWKQTSNGVQLNNLVATTSPLVTSDSALGYSAGSHWYNASYADLFICTSATVGAAVWVRVSDGAINNMVAIVAPTATDDISLNYDVSSLWYDTVTQNLYICTTSTATAAVWLQLTSVGAAINNLAATTVPLVSNDSTQGYTVSSHWYDLSSKNLYICTDATAAAAVWVLVSDNKLNNFAAIIAPTVTDDSSLNYELGSFWVDTSATPMQVWVCQSTTVGAAVWVSLTSPIVSNYTAVVSPALTDDTSLGYSIGSTWVNTLANTSYICVDSTATAAIWNQMDATVIDNLVATIAPSVSADTAAGYSVGSHWYNTILKDLYICTDATAAAAVWVLVSNELKSNYAATVDPIATNDATQSYEIGSIWINITTKQSFICVDSTAGAAVWNNNATPVLNNLTAVIAPTVTDDSSLGYTAGSHWFDTVALDLYMAVSTSVGASVWVTVSNDVKNNFTSSVNPSSGTANLSSGYAIGSTWINTVSNTIYVCTASAVASATWKLLELHILNNYNSIIPPAVTDSSSSGYSVGSQWYDSTGSDLYVCTDSTSGAAVWLAISNDSKNNYIAIVAPSIVDDSSLGYSVGSVWVDVVSNIPYVCVDSTIGAAVWSNSGPSLDNPNASTFETINIAATTAAGVLITTVTTLPIATVFNVDKMLLLLNGVELIKGNTVMRISATAISLSIDVYVGDIIIIKP